MTNELRVLLDVPFYTAPTRQGQRNLVIDLWLPLGQAKPCPTVIYIHGGAWAAGLHYPPPMYPRFWEQGIAIAAITYRFSQEAIFPACLHDCKTAVRWLRAHAAEYHLDPARFAAWGMSAGGHLASLLGDTNGLAEFEGDGPYQEQSSQVQAVVDFCGPEDMERIFEDEQPGLGVPEVVVPLLGASWPENRAQARLASPIQHVRPGLPPHLLVYGDADVIVPLWHGKAYQEKLLAAGVDSELVILPGAGHELNDPAAPQAVERFIHRVFRG